MADEPRRIAEAIRSLGLRYAVITSVDRDDLPDGGAYIFFKKPFAGHETCPGIRLEVLIPDFRGNLDALGSLLKLNLMFWGTTSRQFPGFIHGRRQISYRRSLDHLKNAKSFGIPVTTKSGLMLGLGEEHEEVLTVLRDLKDAAVDIVTAGQYLQPTPEHLPVERFYAPKEFDDYRDFAHSLGFRSVASGPLIRSSYHGATGKRHPLNRIIRRP